MLREVELSPNGPSGVGEMELLVLVALGVKPGRDPTRLAEGLGLRAGRVRKAWSILLEKQLIAPRVDTASDTQPVCEPTEAGRDLAGAALIAVEIAGFEPELLRGLQADELKAPFQRTDRAGGL